MTKTLDRTAVANLRSELNVALAAVAAKHGVDFSLGRIVFTATSMRCKLEGIVRGAAGTNPATPATSRAVDLNKNLWMLGANFDVNGTYRAADGLGVFKVTGYNSKAKKYPWIITKAGKSYKVTTTYVKNAAKVA